MMNFLEKEPNSVNLKQGLFVPQAGVVNYRKVTEALAEELKSHGGQVEYFEEVVSIESKKGGKVLSTKKNKFFGDFLINCGGIVFRQIS